MRFIFDALPLRAVILDLGQIQKKASARSPYKGYDQHGERCRREYGNVVTDVEHNQFHQSSCIQLFSLSPS